jgi:hypothetical protein
MQRFQPTNQVLNIIITTWAGCDCQNFGHNGHCGYRSKQLKDTLKKKLFEIHQFSTKSLLILQSSVILVLQGDHKGKSFNRRKTNHHNRK